MKRILPLIIIISACTFFAVPVHTNASLIPNPDNRGDVTQQRLPCSAATASSGTATPSNCNNDLNPVSGDFLSAANKLWNQVLTIVFLALGAIAVLMLIYSGIQYILAANQPDTAKKARQNILNTVLGIVLLSGSYAIIRLVVSLANTFGS